MTVTDPALCSHAHSISDEYGISQCMYCEGTFTYEDGVMIPWSPPPKKAKKAKKKFRLNRDQDDD